MTTADLRGKSRTERHTRMRQDFAVHFGLACGVLIGALRPAGMPYWEVAVACAVLFIGAAISYSIKYSRLIRERAES